MSSNGGRGLLFVFSLPNYANRLFMQIGYLHKWVPNAFLSKQDYRNKIISIILVQNLITATTGQVLTAKFSY